MSQNQRTIAKRLVGWLLITSHGQRGHLETAPLFTVPCEGREAQFLQTSSIMKWTDAKYLNRMWC